MMCKPFKILSYCQKSKKQVGQQMSWYARLQPESPDKRSLLLDETGVAQKWVENRQSCPVCACGAQALASLSRGCGGAATWVPPGP